LVTCRRPVADSGHVMIIALFVLVVTMTAALLVSLGLNQRFMQYRDEVRGIQLRALVDAGLAETLSKLYGDPNYLASGTVEPLGKGTYAVTTKKISGLVVEVKVRATYWGGRRAIRAVVQIDREEEGGPPRVLSWEPTAFEDVEEP
jgi:hypothetical protein